MSSGSRALPLTEGLVLDIVDYLLDNDGYGYSTQISDSMVNLKPRRYTSREVVGILRNRPMFRHAQSKERKGGIRWRLDVQERAENRGIYERMKKLKWNQISKTLEVMEGMNPDSLDEVYEAIATIWS